MNSHKRESAAPPGLVHLGTLKKHTPISAIRNPPPHPIAVLDVFHRSSYPLPAPICSTLVASRHVADRSAARSPIDAFRLDNGDRVAMRPKKSANTPVERMTPGGLTPARITLPNAGEICGGDGVRSEPIAVIHYPASRNGGRHLLELFESARSRSREVLAPEPVLRGPKRLATAYPPPGGRRRPSALRRGSGRGGARARMALSAP